MTIGLSCFKAYDIRGRVPDELNWYIAYRIGMAYARYLRLGTVVVGYDVRLSSPDLAAALSRGLNDSGADVIDIGLCGTEEVYFQTFFRGAGGGIMVTASHNPMDYNGMKLVREQSKPISGDTGLNDIKTMVEWAESLQMAPSRGTILHSAEKEAYIDHLLNAIDCLALKPLTIVVNAGNGCAGPIIDRLADRLPFTFIRIHHEPDGAFPNGIPNPLLPENRAVTSNAVIRHGANLGIAWDGDFDRCFFFDEQGRFIEGYYLVGLLAQILLKKEPNSKIIHDPRLIWNTLDRVRQGGGIPIQSKTGHAFIKERMRAENALYGGEMSAHHYFRDFAYCDSGMIPWLLIAEHLGKIDQPLSALVNEGMAAYPCSGEINFVVADVSATLNRIRDHYASYHPQIDGTDGLSFSFPDWRFNVRASNTEPLLRLNVESRGDEILLQVKVEEIRRLIENKP